jgi:hypothetical protein
MNESIVAPHKNLKLTANLIGTVAPFIATHDIRYYLRGINVRPHKSGGAVICATNGHALGAVYDPAAVCEFEVTLFIDPRTISACCAKSPGKRTLVIANNRLTVIDSKGGEICIQAGNPIIECKYPDYASVIPTADKLVPGLVGSFNRDYLRQADMAAQACGKAAGTSSRAVGVQFFSVGGDPNSCAVVRAEVMPDFVGVLMPIRADTLLTPVPAWVGLTSPSDDLKDMKAAA